MRRQRWFPDSFGTVEGSYLGYTQWALLADPPRELAAAVIAIGPHDFSRHTRGTGTFNLDLIGWSETVSTSDVGLAAMLRLLTAERRLKPVLASLPLADADDRVLWRSGPVGPSADRTAGPHRPVLSADAVCGCSGAGCDSAPVDR